MLTDTELDKLYTKYSKTLVALAGRTLYSNIVCDAEDAVQHVFMKLLENRDREITFIPAYLQHMVVNECIMRNRHMSTSACFKAASRNNTPSRLSASDGLSHRSLKDTHSDAYTAVLASQLLNECHPKQRAAWQHAFETGQHRFTHGTNTERSRFNRSKIRLRDILSSSNV